MGGTLPAAMKFAQSESDISRSTTAYFYGINVLGAVSGASLSTFVLLPELGDFKSLVIAVIANIAIALLAAFISRRFETSSQDSAIDSQLESTAPISSASSWTTRFILLAALMSGLTFFLMEMVWYRATTPLFGSTVYGFGLVLCVILFGIGIGGFFYSKVIKSWTPTFEMFTFISALQAFFVLLPYFFGDALAHIALVFSESFRHFGLSSLVFCWIIILFIILLIPSIISGIQFPLLVSLLGKGNQGIAKQLGMAYAFNTVGSIIGLLSGGFFLMPYLGLTNCWLLVGALVGSMSFLSIIANALAKRQQSHSISKTNIYHTGTVTALVLLTFTFCLTQICDGPTAYWLQSPIGYGRFPNFPKNTLQFIQAKKAVNSHSVYHKDGREISVTLGDQNEYGFKANGKSDGSSFGDAPTMIMIGMAGSILHHHPESSCIVGLGTGMTAGWLAEVPSMKRVDVLELEPAIFETAKFFKDVNKNCMGHPKVNAILGDAREYLMTTTQKYDLIISEPSNPCRAGVSNLFTDEFYQSVVKKMSPAGLFCQWVQAYEVSPEVILLVNSTLRKNFKHVELWRMSRGDVMFVCKQNDNPWDFGAVSAKIKTYPFHEAFKTQATMISAEGLFAHCTGNQHFTKIIAENYSLINTDDHNQLEYLFAKGLTDRNQVLSPLIESGMKSNLYRPSLTNDSNWDQQLYEEEQLCFCFEFFGQLDKKYLPSPILPSTEQLFSRLTDLRKNNTSGYFKQSSFQPEKTLLGKYLSARYAATQDHALAQDYVNDLDKIMPAEAAILKLMLLSKTLKSNELISNIKLTHQILRQQVWCKADIIERYFNFINTISANPDLTPESIKELFYILDNPLPCNRFSTFSNSIQARLARSLSLVEKEKVLSKTNHCLLVDLNQLLCAQEVYESKDPEKEGETLLLLEKISNLNPNFLPGYTHPFDIGSNVQIKESP
jgi:predicted membrane-bound spermidine synthase